MTDSHGLPPDYREWDENYLFGHTPEYNRGLAESLQLVAKKLVEAGQSADDFLRLAELAEQVEKKQTAQGYRELYAQARVAWTDEYLRELYSQDDAHTDVPIEVVLAEMEARFGNCEPEAKS